MESGPISNACGAVAGADAGSGAKLNEGLSNVGGKEQVELNPNLVIGEPKPLSIDCKRSNQEQEKDEDEFSKDPEFVSEDYSTETDEALSEVNSSNAVSKKEVIPPAEAARKNSDLPDQQEENVFECHFCPKRFPSKFSLGGHMNSHRNKRHVPVEKEEGDARERAPADRSSSFPRLKRTHELMNLNAIPPPSPPPPSPPQVMQFSDGNYAPNVYRPSPGPGFQFQTSNYNPGFAAFPVTRAVPFPGPFIPNQAPNLPYPYLAAPPPIFNSDPPRFMRVIHGMPTTTFVDPRFLPGGRNNIPGNGSGYPNYRVADDDDDDDSGLDLTLRL